LSASAKEAGVTREDIERLCAHLVRSQAMDRYLRCLKPFEDGKNFEREKSDLTARMCAAFGVQERQS
jgi:hypothetical protein